MSDYKKINIYGTGRYVYLGPPDTQIDKEGVYHVTLEVSKDKAQEAKKAVDDVNDIVRGVAFNEGREFPHVAE